MPLSTATPRVVIRQPEGRLGILTPGLGAVATTFIAGVECVRRGLSQPIGSLSAEEAHDAAVQRMGYLFAMVTTTAAVIEALTAHAPAA